MAIQKYKPKGTPHQLENKVAATVSQSAKMVDSAKATIARSRKIVQSSREMVRSITLSKRA